MMLSGIEIKKRLGADIIIEPYDEKYLNPNSYNLTLHDELLVYKDAILDMKKPNETQLLKIPESGFVIEPGRLYLGRTRELTETLTLLDHDHHEASARSCIETVLKRYPKTIAAYLAAENSVVA